MSEKQFPQDVPLPTGDSAITVLGGVRNVSATSKSSTEWNIVPIAVGADGSVKISGSISSGTVTPADNKSEDAAHVSGDTGSFILGVRRDTPTALTSTNADYSPIAVNAYGAPMVVVDSDWQGSYNTGLLKVEDGASASGDCGVNILVKRADAIPNDANVNANGDWVQVMCDIGGRVYINPWGTNPGSMFYASSSAATDTSTTQIRATSGALYIIYVCSVTINNSSGTATFVKLLDGATEMRRLYVPANGSAHYEFGSCPLRGSPNSDLSFQCITTGTSTIVSANGFVQPT